MSDALYRAERCRDLAEEFRRLSEVCTSPEKRNHYSWMAKDYILLADIVEQAYLTERAIEASKRCIESSLLLKAQLD